MAPRESALQNWQQQRGNPVVVCAAAGLKRQQSVITSMLAAMVILLHGTNNAATALLHATADVSAASTSFWGGGAFPGRRVLNRGARKEASGSRISVRRRGGVGLTDAACSDPAAKEVVDGERRTSWDTAILVR